MAVFQLSANGTLFGLDCTVDAEPLNDGSGAYLIDSVTGTVDGATINGLGNTGEDNYIYPSASYYGLYLDGSGISFISGDSAYHVYGLITTSHEGPVPFGYAEEVGGNTGLISNFVALPDCFMTTTLICTNRGEVAVEALRLNDLIITASGKKRPIRWIGHRTIDCRKHPRAAEVYPVRVAAHAFGRSRPARDLCLSQGHPVLVGDTDGEGGHLVPIMCLVNGTTIVRTKVEEITYWHVELNEHDIVIAEGLPAESYIDLGSRPWFAGADGTSDPDFALPGMPGRCRPVSIDGPVVEAERRRLDAVFALQLASAAAWPGAEEAFAI